MAIWIQLALLPTTGKTWTMCSLLCMSLNFARTRLYNKKKKICQNELQETIGIPRNQKMSDLPKTGRQNDISQSRVGLLQCKPDSSS